MLILKAVLALFLATPGTTSTTPPPGARPAVAALGAPELARAIKTDLESILGPGTVEVSVDGGTRFRVRIAVPSFNSKIWAQIRDRETGLYRLFPDLDFDFYFGGPELARAIKTDIESISGSGTVDVSIDSGTLFNVRIAVPSYDAQVYTQVYDRALELYRLFPDLNFDFYLRPKPTRTEQPRR